MRKYLDEVTYEEAGLVPLNKHWPTLLARLIDIKSNENGGVLHTIDENHLTFNVPLVKELRKHLISIMPVGFNRIHSDSIFHYLSCDYIEKQVIPYLNGPEYWTLRNFKYLYSMYRFEENEGYFAKKVLGLCITKANKDEPYREELIETFISHTETYYHYDFDNEKDLYFMQQLPELKIYMLNM